MDHEKYMLQALEQAQKAYDANEVPIGAVIVDKEGRVIAQAHNQVEFQCSQTAHAEMLAIAQAGKEVGNWRLAGCMLYVTLEPCSMCMSLALLSRVAGVVYAAASPVFGYHLDNSLAISLYKRDAFEVISGVCQKEAEQLLQKFFQEKRERSYVKGEKLCQ